MNYTTLIFSGATRFLAVSLTIFVFGILVIGLFIWVSPGGPQSIIAWVKTDSGQQEMLEKLFAIGRAIEVYQDEKNQIIQDQVPEDRVSLSWRVKLLPYLGEQSLYDSFRLHEPWNSDHNIKLLDRIPHVFLHPCAAVRDAQRGHTHFCLVRDDVRAYLALNLNAKHAIKSPIVVEINKPVVWTCPDLPQLRAAKPALGLYRPGSYYGYFTDRSASSLPTP